MYKLVVKGNNVVGIFREVVDNLGLSVAVKDVRQIPGWDESFVLVDTDLHESTMFDKLNRWLNKDKFLDPPFPLGSLLWWHKNQENEGEPKEVMPVTVISSEGSFGGVLMSDDTIRLVPKDTDAFWDRPLSRMEAHGEEDQEPIDVPEDDEVGDYDPDLVPEDLPF